VCTTTDLLAAFSFHSFIQVSTHKHVAVTFYYDMWPYSEALLLVFERAAAEDTFKDIHFAKVNIQEQEVKLPNVALHTRSNTLPGHHRLAGNRGLGEYSIESRVLKIYSLRKSEFSPTEREIPSSSKLPRRSTT